jgi:histone H3/H4
MARTKMTSKNRGGKAVPRKNMMMAKKSATKSRNAAVQETNNYVRRRARQGTRAIAEIKKAQGRSKFSIKRHFSKLGFERLVREITQDMGHQDIRWRKGALSALQEMGEAIVTYHAADAQDLALHAGRAEIQRKDLRLAVVMRSMSQESRNLEQMNLTWTPLREGKRRRRKLAPGTRVVSRAEYYRLEGRPDPKQQPRKPIRALPPVVDEPLVGEDPTIPDEDDSFTDAQDAEE